MMAFEIGTRLYDTDEGMLALKDSNSQISGLYTAIEEENLILGKFFIQKLDHKYLNSPSEPQTMTPLNFAVSIRDKTVNKDINLELIRLLLVSGADVNRGCGELREDGFHSSVLIKALTMSDVKLAELLICYGAKKFYAFSLDKKRLFQQQFMKAENTTYKLAKRKIRYTNSLFIFASKEGNSSIGFLPFEIVSKILTSGKLKSSNNSRVKLAKEQILIQEEVQASLDQICMNFTGMDWLLKK